MLGKAIDKIYGIDYNVYVWWDYSYPTDCQKCPYFLGAGEKAIIKSQQQEIEQLKEVIKIKDNVLADIANMDFDEHRSISSIIQLLVKSIV